jgi:hypothetical protein
MNFDDWLILPLKLFMKPVYKYPDLVLNLPSALCYNSIQI